MASMSHSPASSTDAHSDVESPRLNKLIHPTMGFTPQIPAKAKQHRSSSINSLGSTQSTHQRSLSLVSLELPRNSIVSIDDIFIRPPRNDSSSSLASLGGAGSPKELPRDNLLLATRLLKNKIKSSCVILSDEENSESEHHPVRAGYRRKSSEKILKPTFLSSLKRDFKFKYDHDFKQKQTVNSPTSAPRVVEDSHPSPLSLNVEGPHQSAMPLNILDDEASSSIHRGALPGKKLRSSSMTQLMFLKKKLFLSKDIQLELLSGHQSSTPSPISTVPDTRYPFPSIKLPMPTRDLIHNFFSSQVNEPISHHLPPLAPFQPQPLAQSAPSKPTHTMSRPISPSANIPNNHHQCSELSIKEQNELLSKLNRKWNKAIFNTPTESDLSDPLFNSVATTRKRGRSELASSTDSFSIANTKP